MVFEYLPDDSPIFFGLLVLVPFKPLEDKEPQVLEQKLAGGMVDGSILVASLVQFPISRHQNDLLFRHGLLDVENSLHNVVVCLPAFSIDDWHACEETLVVLGNEVGHVVQVVVDGVLLVEEESQAVVGHAVGQVPPETHLGFGFVLFTTLEELPEVLLCWQQVVAVDQKDPLGEVELNEVFLPQRHSLFSILLFELPISLHSLDPFLLYLHNFGVSCLHLTWLPS